MSRVLALALFTGLLARAEAPATPLMPRPLPPEAWSETWTTLVQGADGTLVRFELAISNLGPGDQHGGCRLVVVEPDGTTWRSELVTESGGWSHAAGPPEQLVIGPCRAEAAGGLVVQAGEGGTTARVEVAARPFLVEPPATRVDLGRGDIFDEAVLVPWAPATVSLSGPSGPRTLEGTASVDRYRVTLMPDQLAEVWVRFRGLGEGPPLLLEARVTPEGRPDEGFAWWADGPGPGVLESLSVDLRPGASKVPAWDVRVSSQGRELVITSGPQLTRYAPVEGHGVFTLLAKVMVGNPVTRTYRAAAVGPDGERTEGFLEVMQLED